jgi:hypothetical protein
MLLLLSNAFFASNFANVNKTGYFGFFAHIYDGVIQQEIEARSKRVCK